MDTFGSRGPRNPDDEIRVAATSGGRVLRRFWPYLLGVVVVLWLASGIYIVPPESQGIVRVFGAWIAPCMSRDRTMLPHPRLGRLMWFRCWMSGARRLAFAP